MMSGPPEGSGHADKGVTKHNTTPRPIILSRIHALPVSSSSTEARNQNIRYDYIIPEMLLW